MKTASNVANREIVKLLPFDRHAEVRAASFEEASNSIEVIWTTGAKVRRYDWRGGTFYDEELVVSANAIRLDRLNNGAPLLDTHDDWTLSSVIGSVVPGSAEVRAGKGFARVQLSVAPEHEGIVANIKAGVIRNISVGYRAHRIEKIEGGDGEVATWRLVDWEPLEISAVPVPADAGSMIRSEQRKEREERLAPCEFIRTRGSSLVKATTFGDEETMTQPNQPTPLLSEDTWATCKAAAIEATGAERARTRTIRNLAAQAGVPELGETHAVRDTTVEQFRSLLLDHLVSAEAPHVRSMTGVQFGQSNHEQRAAAIHNALMHRASPGTVELTADGRNFRGMTLLEIGRDVLEINGINTRGMTRIEIAAQALIPRSAGGLHTTSDFGGILANVANTTLRAAYEAAPQTFRPLVRETSVSDFKTVTRAQLGEAPALNKVSEHGEFKRGSLGEGKESYKIATYGKIVGITRQVIINDDLDAFSRLPAAFGVQAAQLESDLVWAQILANPVMGDGKTLFHAGHGNIFTPAAAISVSTMSAGRVAFSKQTGLDGKTILGLTPRYVIVPIAMLTMAEQLKGQIYAAKNSDVVPESMKAFEIIAEARLDNGINRPEDGIVAAGSATAWYLAGSIEQNDIIELAYLNGNRGVYTETRAGFDIDGVEVKARLDVGAKVIEHRNIAKNAGA